METVMERECSALGGLFQTVITDMKGSYPVWEDFISKAGKLQAQLRATVVAVSAFLDAFQKVADLATGSRVMRSLKPELVSVNQTASFNRMGPVKNNRAAICPAGSPGPEIPSR
ncbi:protein MTSS 1 isoform X1 [Tachysurus ichikawai]